MKYDEGKFRPRPRMFIAVWIYEGHSYLLFWQIQAESDGRMIRDAEVHDIVGA